jgi:hypothetical protein
MNNTLEGYYSNFSHAYGLDSTYEAVGKDNIKAKITPLQQIVVGLFFQYLVPNSWNKSSCATGKLAVCAKTCGGKHDAFAEQFK